MGVTNFDTIQLDGATGGATAALVFGAGTSASPATTATADKNFLDFRTQSTATSGDARGIYNRLYLAGAGVSGESLRSFTTVNNVAAATAHGAHISLSFGATGTITGQGIATRSTLHLKDEALASNVTMAALQAEIYSDGANSDPGGSTKLSYLRCVNDGHANGIADVDDDASLIEIIGHTIGAGNMVVAEVDETKFSHKIRINIGGTTYYLMACAT
ncbi:MAG: hypothetical protein IPH82_30180 [Chloroflexi bacterium]|nr:hypothetical protein [Chloroflexota bacterium]